GLIHSGPAQARVRRGLRHMRPPHRCDGWPFSVPASTLVYSLLRSCGKDDLLSKRASNPRGFGEADWNPRVATNAINGERPFSWFRRGQLTSLDRRNATSL